VTKCRGFLNFNRRHLNFQNQVEGKVDLVACSAADLKVGIFNFIVANIVFTKIIAFAEADFKFGKQAIISFIKNSPLAKLVFEFVGKSLSSSI
jgi:hypothetical protein